MRTLLFLFGAASLFAADPADSAKALRTLALRDGERDPKASGTTDDVGKDLRQRLLAANQADREAWQKVQSKADWEKFRDVRVQALRNALGTFPDAPKSLNVRITKTIKADGYHINNCLYESRPGLWVTGNLYQPAKPGAACPGIMICHSHHNPKHEGELQDMGVLWAKLGCYVLVIDQLGHGERREHPFADAKAFPEAFRVGRQDYFFRYNVGTQLSLAGESLIGWMAWDMMRGVDLLLQQPGIAKEKIILLGAVAGGGDPAAVTAALDPRINCVCPFNFGGPQPETKYPLPDDAETSFNYAGGGSWESTRNIRDSVKGGFLPWTIVASVAPRKVIHAHEFSWDQARDPVWKRYQQVFAWYNAKENLAFATGRGVIVGNDPNASHCNNIGVIHRQLIYKALQQWYGIPVPEKEVRERRTADELRCWTPDAMKELQPRPLHQLLAVQSHRTPPPKNDTEFRERLATSLGVALRKHRVEEKGFAELAEPELPAGIVGRRLAFAGNGPKVSALLLAPQPPKDGGKFPVVVGVCQDGYPRFLHDRADAVARLLHAECAVLLVSVRGTGVNRPGDSRGRTSAATSHSASAQMLGETLLGQRLADLQCVLDALPTLTVVDAKRIALWGESFATPNAADAVVAVPYDVAKPPTLAEPLAATLVGLAALDRPEVKALVARGGLVRYRSLYDSPFFHVPHDALPVRALAWGDLDALWGQHAQRAVRLEGVVDGVNRRLSQDALQATYQTFTKQGKFDVASTYSSDEAIARWLKDRLTK